MDGAKAVRLTVIGGDFSQEFIVGNTGGGDQMQFLPYPLLDFFGNVDRQGNLLFIFRHIEEGFIQRKRFDDIRILMENLVDL